MNRLVDAVAPALAVGDAAQRGGREEAERSGDDGRLVGDDVAEEVARDDDAVQGSRVSHHQHRGRVDEVVAELELGELVLHRLGNDAAPEARGCEDVGLVERPDL